MTGNRPSRNRFPHVADILLFATENRDATSSLEPTTTVIASDITCLVVDKGGNRITAYGKEQQEKAVRVLFPDPIRLGLANAIRYTTEAGLVRILLIKSARDDIDLNRLYVAECEEFVPTNPTS